MAGCCGYTAILKSAAGMVWGREQAEGCSIFRLSTAGITVPLSTAVGAECGVVSGRRLAQALGERAPCCCTTGTPCNAGQDVSRGTQVSTLRIAQHGGAIWPRCSMSHAPQCTGSEASTREPEVEHRHLASIPPAQNAGLCCEAQQRLHGYEAHLEARRKAAG